MRIALFGGTFDPPHRGHVAIARAAVEAFALDLVLFAPTGVQPLKLYREATPYAERLALVEAACGEDARFRASEIDAPRPDGGPNYTVETLARLVAEYPGDTLFALAGADAFLGLRQWREPERLLELVEWIVVTRPGYPLGEAELAGMGLSAAERARLHVLAGVEEDVSATELRERLRRGEGCGDVLPEGVAEQIAAGRLYR
jgi:nicotinate-nucleotide adenylyltransferase